MKKSDKWVAETVAGKASAPAKENNPAAQTEWPDDGTERGDAHSIAQKDEKVKLRVCFKCGSEMVVSPEMKAQATAIMSQPFMVEACEAWLCPKCGAGVAVMTEIIRRQREFKILGDKP